MAQKQTRLAEDPSFFQTRQPLCLKYFLETKTSAAFPLFLSEHGYVAWNTFLKRELRLHSLYFSQNTVTLPEILSWNENFAYIPSISLRTRLCCLKYFLETRTSPTFPLFLSEHGNIAWNTFLKRKLRLHAHSLYFCQNTVMLPEILSWNENFTYIPSISLRTRLCCLKYFLETKTTPTFPLFLS